MGLHRPFSHLLTHLLSGKGIKSGNDRQVDWDSL